MRLWVWTIILIFLTACSINTLPATETSITPSKSAGGMVTPTPNITRSAEIVGGIQHRQEVAVSAKFITDLNYALSKVEEALQEEKWEDLQWKKDLYGRLSEMQTEGKKYGFGKEVKNALKDTRIGLELMNYPSIHKARDQLLKIRDMVK